MKLLMTADTVGGVWTYTLELARALQPYDVTVTLATMGARLGAYQRAEVGALDNVRVHESEFRLEWMEDPWDDVKRAADWLLELEKLERPDLVHLNGYGHADLSWGAPVLVVAHSCVRSWWDAVRGESALPECARYTEWVRAGLHAADMVVAPSRAMRSAAEHHYGRLSRSRVIFNGRDASRFAPAPKEPFVLGAGRLWDPAKNLAALDRVAGELPWPVYVAGDATSPDGRHEEFGAVHALGALDPPRLAAWMASASIYVLPAYYEPFGLSVLEAALSGCALVLGDIPSLREIWRDAALFVAPDDHASLARAIRRLADDEALRRVLAGRARRRARVLSPARMARHYHAAYATLLYDARRQSRTVLCAS